MGRRGGTPFLLIASRKTGQFGDGRRPWPKRLCGLGKIEGLLLSHGTILQNADIKALRVILAIHFDKHVTINISQRLHDPALCLVTLFLIEVRRRLVRFDRHADHKPSGYFALSERSGQNGNSGY
jgi:hypothetical protein